MRKLNSDCMTILRVVRKKNLDISVIHGSAHNLACLYLMHEFLHTHTQIYTKVYLLSRLGVGYTTKFGADLVSCNIRASIY